MIYYPKSSSLNEVINEDGDELIELIPYEDDIDNQLVVDDRIKTELNNALSNLDERERVIIECYFGINTDCEPMTLEAIGEIYGLTKERIRQIKASSLRKLRSDCGTLFDVIDE